MRVAILSAVRADPDGEYSPLALESYAGASILRRQTDLALDLGCKRVIVVAQQSHHEITKIQHLVEKSSGKFHLASGPHQVAQLVAASDRLLVIDDAVLIDPAGLPDNFAKSGGICGLPAREAMPLGFERIDAEHAWAGALTCPGSAAEALRQLPADVDVAPSLLRIALQSGVPIMEMSQSSSDSSAFERPKAATDIASSEKRSVAGQIRRSNWLAPFNALADRFASRTAVPLLSRGLGAAGGFLITLAGIGLAVTAGWFGGAGAGFLGLAIAGFAARVFETLSNVSAWQRSSQRQVERSAGLATILLDAALLAIVALNASRSQFWSTLFAAAMLVGMLRLLHQRSLPGWCGILKDRVLVALILASSAFLGWLLPFLQGFTIILTLLAIALANGKMLTRN